jgi:hypothetical protein
MTGCFFEAKAGHVLRMDGTDHDTLWLPYPPTTTAGITKVEIATYDSTGANWTEVASTLYEVIMATVPDGRFNPKLQHMTGAWPKGRRNVRITGTFGFVESNGTTTPPFIVDLAKRIAIWNMPLAGDAAAQKSDRIIEEQLKDYRYKLADPSAASAGMFGDPRIDGPLAMFRKPAMRVI